MAEVALTRRQLLTALGVGAFAVACRRRATSPREPIGTRLDAIERSVRGRLGVVAMTRNGTVIASHRADERFAMCSTFKLPLAAAILARVDSNNESLDRTISFTPTDLLEYAPVVRAHLAEGNLRIESLSEAVITLSDNSAANLLLSTLDGPAGLTRFFRSIGDTTSRLDRTEPTLNTAIVGDPRDTTTPRAMAETVRRIVFGDVLRDASRTRIVRWLEACSTGRERLRAGLPNSWRTGDKTGTGENGATNDVAVAWPTHGEPIVIAAYLTECAAAAEARNAALAQVARVITAE